MQRTADLDLSPRILLGPGPSAVSPRVLRVMTTPPIGYLDPEWLAFMDEEQALLREVWQTENPLTLALSGTGSSGMEAAIANFLEPGDRFIVGVNGFFGNRMCDMAARYGATVTKIEAPWGEPIKKEQIAEALKQGPAKMVALVHAETSTGVLQDLTGIADVVHGAGALLMLDCVTSLAGVPVKIDAMGVDVAYSATQKCLGAPTGLAPFTVSPKGVAALEKRKNPTPNWYLDLAIIAKYWDKNRAYHHTPSTALHYALREGLRMALEEGLEKRWARHRANAEYLWAELAKMKISLHVAPENRLPPLTTVKIPDGVDDPGVRKRLREEFAIEIAGGFGPLAGKVWRVGLMGFSSRRENIAALIGALKEIL